MLSSVKVKSDILIVEGKSMLQFMGKLSQRNRDKRQ